MNSSFVPLEEAERDVLWNVDYDGKENAKPKPETALGVIMASSLADKPVPSREWRVEGLIPSGTVTLLSGDGGTGKSLLALQLAVATATGGFWAGKAVTAGYCLYISAEDDLDEIHRRLADVAAAADVRLLDLERVSISAMAGKDAIMAVPEAKTNILKATAIYGALEDTLRTERYDLVVIDTLADVFGGEENQRAQARQFVGMLRGLCVRHGVTIVMLAHPSIAGMASGTGSSGSTAWNNSVRSRLYFERLKDGDGTEADPDVRVLRTVKSNYGRTGEEIRLRWHAGAFSATATTSSFTTLASQSKADRLFLELVAAYETEGRPVTASTGHGYAPALFAKDSRADGINKNGFAMAMNRLFAASQLRNVEYGPPSRRYRKIEVVPAQERE